VAILTVAWQSWKELHAAHAVCADTFSELRSFWIGNMSQLKICAVILIDFAVNIKE
jgi:hypothetical protein